MSNNVPTLRPLRSLVCGALLASLVATGCYRQSRDEQVPVVAEGVPTVVASDARDDSTAGDSDYAVRILEVRCYRIQEGRRVGERIRNFFAYSLVDQEAMDHYRDEFGNPQRRRGEESANVADDDVTCEYVPSSNRDFTVLVDDRPVGLSSTDSSGFLRLDNIEVGANATVVAVDSVTGERVVVQSSESVPLPSFTHGDDGSSPLSEAPPARGSSTGSVDDDGRTDEVDFSDVPPGGPFDDEGPFDTVPGASGE